MHYLFATQQWHASFHSFQRQLSWQGGRRKKTNASGEPERRRAEGLASLHSLSLLATPVSLAPGSLLPPSTKSQPAPTALTSTLFYRMGEGSKFAACHPPLRTSTEGIQISMGTGKKRSKQTSK